MIPVSFVASVKSEGLRSLNIETFKSTLPTPDTFGPKETHKPKPSTTLLTPPELVTALKQKGKQLMRVHVCICVLKIVNKNQFELLDKCVVSPA